MGTLFTSKRILLTSDNTTRLISGGILVSSTDGTITKIFTSQEEINSWMFKEHGCEVNIFSIFFIALLKALALNFSRESEN